jgi:hypothetical protein
MTPTPHKERTSSVTVSKTVNIPAGMVLLLFQDAKMRSRWISEKNVEVLKTTETSVRMKWADGVSVVTIFVQAKTSNKTQVTVQHEQLPSARAAERQRTFWIQELERLRAAIE